MDSGGVCLNCRKEVEWKRDDASLACPGCGQTYPVVHGIPLLVTEPRLNLAAAYLQYGKHIDECEKRLEEVRDARGRQPNRAALLDRAIAAYEHDIALFTDLRASLLDHVSESEVEELESEGRLPRQYTLGEGIAFYPRDWCRSDAAEREIATIVDTVRGYVEAYASDADRVCVPGAGAGRFACELAAVYDDVFAFDYSYHMARLFRAVVDGGLTIHRVNFRSNVVRTEDVVVRYDLSLDAAARSRIDGRLIYAVTNALDVPLPGNALSAVACIYFIDMVPVREHMLEVRRLLKPGGLFINFGPLRYMRGDVANMLSGEEILDLYRESGFDILAHDVVPNTQLAASPVITSVHSNNFTFVARKR